MGASFQVEEFVWSYVTSSAFRSRVSRCEENRGELSEGSSQIVIESAWFLENRKALDSFADLIKERAFARIRSAYPTFMLNTSRAAQRRLFEGFVSKNALPISDQSSELAHCFFEFVLHQATMGKLNPAFVVDALFRDQALRLLTERVKRKGEGSSACIARIDEQLLSIDDCDSVLRDLDADTRCELFYIRGGKIGLLHRTSCDARFLRKWLERLRGN
jgi:hypothetical protein